MNGNDFLTTLWLIGEERINGVKISYNYVASEKDGLRVTVYFEADKMPLPKPPKHEIYIFNTQFRDAEQLKDLIENVAYELTSGILAYPKYLGDYVWKFENGLFPDNWYWAGCG